jgi:hypothetical protein
MAFPFAFLFVWFGLFMLFEFSKAERNPGLALVIVFGIA